ncbi:MAG: hypothetical protein IJ558_04700 [Treponema sp.]|nr:hypothetical protein [Treponema sp.]
MNELATTNGTSLTPEQAFPFQKEIDTWNMDEAVARIRPKVEEHKKLSAELARDLWIANSVLARRGGDRRSEDAHVFGFCDFLELVGVSKKKAYLLLKLYVPEEDKLLTFDEYDERRLKSANPAVEELSPAQQELQSTKERLIAHAMATGERLFDQGWNELGCEKEYRIRVLNKKLSDIARELYDKKVQYNWKDDDYFSTTVLAQGKTYAKFTMQTKEQMIAQNEVLEMLSRYLESFGDPAIRMAAVCNIGLRIRSTINKMHEADLEYNKE